ncbi:MAG: 4Fe-4S dicluster domain-containing protein, partial [Spirochaetia bacterium]|nr:4Fe-4S dicluster domain-containing protein [Spirochaetia bacterium]
VEDCAVDVADLPEFYRRHEKLIQDKGVMVSTSAHAGTGELHTVPFLDLGTKDGLRLLREILEETVVLTKEFQGSLSGEHGDGRLRGEFIRKMIGEKNYEICRRIKKTWDPGTIFNPNKVVDAPPVEKDLRYLPGKKNTIQTVFNWDRQGGVLRAAELCNGMGECKKTGKTGGIMCPSYMATLDEKHTTRGRANILREYLTSSTKKNPFDHKEILEVMDLCLSCKGCKSECPSSVDVAKLKAEFLQNYYDANGSSLRSKLIAGFASNMAFASLAPWLFNFLARNGVTSFIFNKLIGFSTKRSIPTLHAMTLDRWYKKNDQRLSSKDPRFQGSLYLFCDEFTNLNDTNVGIAA